MPLPPGFFFSIPSLISTTHSPASKAIKMASVLSMLPAILESLRISEFTKDGISAEYDSHKQGELRGFFKLPLEIREDIYKYALPQSMNHNTCIKSDNPNFEFLADPGNRRTPNHVYAWYKGNMSLLAVNRQINSEATKVFWRSNVFSIVIDSANPALVIRYFDESSLRFSTSKQMREISEFPKEWLGLIKHVYLVIRRSSDFTYEPNLTRALEAAVLQESNPAIEGSIGRKYAKMLRVQRNNLLHKGLLAALQALNLIPPVTRRPEDWNGRALRRQKCAVRDVELVIYPSRHLYEGKVFEIDAGLRSEAEYCFQARLAKDAYRIIELKPWFDNDHDPRAWMTSQSLDIRTFGLPFVSFGLTGFVTETQSESAAADEDDNNEELRED
jgi:hypothetical protein